MIRATVRAMRPQMLAGGLSALMLLGGLVGTTLQVYRLERSELEHEGESLPLNSWAQRPGATKVSARLATVELNAGTEAVFEVCSQDTLAAERWLDALQFVVFQLEPLKLMLKVPLDRPHLEAVKRGGQGACLPLGGGVLDTAGRYSVDAVWANEQPSEAVMTVPLRARVLGRTPLGPLAKALVIVTALGVLLALAALSFSRPTTLPTTEVISRGSMEVELPMRGNPGAAFAAALAVTAVAAASKLPLWGSTLALAKGAILAATQVGLALLLVSRLDLAARLRELRLARPQRLTVWLPLALVSGLLLVLSARLSLRLVPATGEAPIQTFISWPSGMLSFAALGVLLPFAEEVFFRGYLYRTALRWGTAAAFMITLVLFIALHAEQSWGNWGGLLAISVTGIVLTALRAVSGSALVPAFAHLTYNFVLSMGSF